jgi:hypothetical protein
VLDAGENAAENAAERRSFVCSFALFMMLSPVSMPCLEGDSSEMKAAEKGIEERQCKTRTLADHQPCVWTWNYDIVTDAQQVYINQ